ncbi:MAG: hypothetical protein ABH879_02600 [archaeon]
MGRINILIPDEMHRKAKARSALEGLTLTEFINQAISEKLKNGQDKHRDSG